MMTMEELRLGLLSVNKQEEAQDVFDIIAKSHEESARTGAAFCIPRVVCVAQKPKEEESVTS